MATLTTSGQRFWISYTPRAGGEFPAPTREKAMKKQAKKLKLAKETVRRLMAGDLMDVAGGYTRNSPTYGSCGAWICEEQPIETSC
jgi:hypothetical protein